MGSNRLPKLTGALDLLRGSGSPEASGMANDAMAEVLANRHGHCACCEYFVGKVREMETSEKSKNLSLRLLGRSERLAKEKLKKLRGEIARLKGGTSGNR